MKTYWKWLAAALVMAALLCSAAMAEAKDITKKCKYWASEGKTSAVTDSDINTGWNPKSAGAELRIGFPEGTGYIYVDWYNDPTGFVFTQYDANKQPISKTTQQDTYAGICHLFRLESGARFASLQLTQTGQSVQGVRVYTQGDLPLKVKDFLPPHDKCDLMVVSTHQDDEWIFFGGIIPYYEYVMEKKVQTVYMTDCGRLRRGEALNGLWAGGVRNYPEFINLFDESIPDLDAILLHWGGRENLLGVLVERIRRFQPEVILTHDYEGEYGHSQHKQTARHMQAAIEAAADPAQYPESYEKYGAWQTKKLYIHLDKQSEIDFDWNKPYEQLRGYTPLQVAFIGYSKHESQHRYISVQDGGLYDNSRFGLTYSTVGDDVLHNDLFENISDETTPGASPEPTPQPTAESTPQPTAAPLSPEPTDMPVVTAEPERTAAPFFVEEDSGSSFLTAAVAALGAAVILCAAGAVAVVRVRKQKKRRRRKKNVRR